MNTSMDYYLCKKYPKIFVDRHGNPLETCMTRGFECDGGWVCLIDNLCQSIQNYIDNNNRWVQSIIDGKSVAIGLIPELIEQVVAQQVKEKLGGLRFYHKGGDDTIRGMVMFAQDLSFNICEMCGSFDNVSMVKSKTGWLKTKCAECNPIE